MAPRRPKYKYETREEWLQALTAALRPWFEELLLTVPPVRISVGFTSKGARSKRIGECWSSAASDDQVPQVFIHPALNDPEAVASTVLHELVHAAVGTEAKHGPAFKTPAVALGLVGRMTATVPTESLLRRLKPVLKALGPYPHGALRPGTSSTGPKQTTRMLKCECGTCGYTVRTTQKWIDLGTPICPVDEIPLELAS